MSRTWIMACGGAAALAALLVVADAADAGGRLRGRGPGPGAAPGVERPARPEGPPPFEALDLTEEQQEQIAALRQTHRAEARALRESGDTTREAFQALRETHRDQVAAILTEAQRAQLEALRAERQALRAADGAARGEHRRPRDGQGWQRPRGSEGFGPRPGAAGGPLAALDLTEEQRAQVTALRTQLRTQMQALRDSGEGSREAARTLFEAHREQVQALLTEEQLAQLEALRAARPEGPRGRRFGGRGHGPPADAGAAKAAGAAVESRTWGEVKGDIDR